MASLRSLLGIHDCILFLKVTSLTNVYARFFPPLMTTFHSTIIQAFCLLQDSPVVNTNLPKAVHVSCYPLVKATLSMIYKESSLNL